MKTRHESNKQNIFIRSMSVSLCAAFFITNVVGAQAPKTDNDSRLRHSGMTLQLNKGSRLKTSGTSFWSERQKAVKAAKEYAQLPGNSPVSLFNKGHTSIPSFSKGGLGSIIPDITGIEAKAKQQNATTVPNSIAKNGPGWLRSLPYNYGTLEEFYASPQKGSPVVVFVQDVHGHYEAQLNIANIIQEIVNREQKDGNVVTTPDKSGNYNELNNSPVIIGLEGAVGAFNFSSYRAFPNKEINKEIADYFLKSGLISGPEYTGLVSDTEPMFWGVEDKDTYLANIEAFKESLSLRDNAKKQIETAARRVVDLKRKIYSPEMRSLDEKIEGYHNGTLGLGEYLEYLSRPNVLAQLLKHERVTELQRGNGAYQGIYKKASTSPPVIGRRPEHETATAPDKSGNYNSAIKNPKSTKFPNVRQFLDTFKLEKTINFQKVEDERRILIEKLVNVLSKEELESLVYQAVSYRMGNIDNGTYYRGLEAVCQKHGLKLNNWPELAQYVRYTIGADRIDRRALFKEINGVEDKVVAQFTGGEALSSFRIERRSTTPDKSGNYMIVAMDVYEISKNLALISKLIDNNLTDEEWKTYLSNKEKIHSIFSRLNAVAQFTGGEALSSFRIERRLNNDATTTPDKSGNYTTTAPDKSGNYNERYNGKMSFPFETFEKFYETATSRNRILVENLLSANSTLTSTCRISLLVAGGFHTQSMAKLLKEKQISYAVLSPKLTEIDQESHYLDVFAQKSTPLDKLMLGEKIFLAAYRNMGSVVPLAPSQMEVRHNLLGGLQVALGTMGLSSSEIEQAKARFERLIKRLPAIKDAQVGNTYEARNGDHVVPVWINGHGFAVAVSQLKDGVSREVTIEGQVSGKMRNFAFTIRPLTIKEKSTQIIPITQAKARKISPDAAKIITESLKIAAVVTLVAGAVYLIFSGNHQFAGAGGMVLMAITLDSTKAAGALHDAARNLRSIAGTLETAIAKFLTDFAQIIDDATYFLERDVIPTDKDISLLTPRKKLTEARIKGKGSELDAIIKQLGVTQTKMGILLSSELGIEVPISQVKISLWRDDKVRMPVDVLEAAHRILEKVKKGELRDYHLEFPAIYGKQGDKLRATREEIGLSTREMSAQLSRRLGRNISKTSLSLMERGEQAMVKDILEESQKLLKEAKPLAPETTGGTGQSSIQSESGPAMQPVKIAGLVVSIGLITALTWATVLGLYLSGVVTWNSSWSWALGIGSALSLVMVSLFKWEAKRYIEEIKDASNIGVLWGLTLLGRPVRTKEIAETKKEALSLSLIMRHLEMINGKPQLDAFESELLDNFRDMIVENLKVKGKLSSEDEQKIKALNFELFLPQRPAEDKKRVGLGGIVGTIKDISHVRNNRAPPEVTAQLVYDKTTSQLKTIRIIPSKTLDILFAKSFVQDLIGDLGIFDAQKPDDLIRLISLVSPIAKNYAPKNFKTIIRGLSSVSFRARESVLRILEIKLTTRLASSRLAQVIYHEIGHVVYGKSNEIAATWMERHAGLRAWPRIIINIPLLVLKKALWGSRSEGRNIVFTDATSGMGKLLAWMFSVSKDNVAIYVRDRNATAELPVESKRLKYVQSENKSLADKSLLTKLIKGNDVFFHHAGIPLPKKDVPNDQQYELLAINGFLTGTITELIKTFNPDSKLIYTSSQMVYVLENKPAILDDTLPVTYSDETELWLTTAVAEFKEWFAELKDDQFETALIEFTKGFIGRYGYPHIPGGKGLVDPYSLSKALGERFVMELENYAIMRPTNFIGLGYPYESGRTIPKNIKAIKDGGTIPTSDEFRDFVDTQDAAKVWMEAAALPRGQQTINVASGKMTHIRNVYQAAWVKLRSRNNLPEESARQATQPYEVKNDTAKHLLGREFRNVVEYVGAYVDYMNADIKGKRKILNSTTKSRGGVELIPLFILGALGVLGLGVAALLANDMFDFGQTLNMVMNWKTWQSVALPMLGTGLSAFVFSIMFQQGMRGHNPSRWGHAEASEVRTTAGLLKDGEPIHGRTGDTWNIHQRIPPRDLAGIGLGIYDFKVESTESGKTLEEFLAAKDARLISRIKEGKSLVFLNHEQISDLSVKLNTGDSIGIVPRISGGSGREDETSGAFELYSAEIAALSGKSRWDKKKIAYLLERLLQSLAVMENRVVSSGHHSLPANIAQARTLYDNNKTLQDVPRFDNVDSAIKRLITVRENNVELSSYSLGYLITALWAGDKIPEDELQDWTLTASAVNYALEHKEDISRTIRYIWQHSYVGSRRVVLDSLDRKQNPLLPLWMYKQQVFSTNLMVDRLLEHYTFRYEIETVLKKGKYLTSDVWEYWHIIAYSALYFYGNDLIAELARETGDTPNMPPMLGGLNYEQLVAFIEKVNSGETPLADLIGYFHQTGLDQISIALEHLSAEYHQAFNEGITSLSVMTPLPIVSGSDLENIITQTFVPGGHYYNELQSFLDEQAAIVANYYLLESSYGQFYKDVENFQEGNYLITVEVSADLRDGIGTVKIKIGRIDKKELAPNELNELKRHLFQLIVEESPGKTHSLEPKQFTLDWEENRGVIEHTVSAMFGFYAFGQASHYQLGAWGTTKYEHSAEQQVIKVIMKLHGGQKDDTTVFFGMGINPFPKKLDGSIDWQATWQALKNHAWLTLGLIAIAGVLGYSMGPKMAVYAMGAGFGLAAAYFNNLRVSGQNGSVEDGRIDVKRATQKFNELLEDLENANKAKDDTALKTYRQALAMLLADVINGAKEIIKSGTNKWDISDVDYFDELVSLASVIYVRLLADKNIRFDAVKDTLQTQLYAGEETDAEKWLKISNLIKTDSETTTANNHDLAFTAEVPTREALEQLFDKVVQDGRLQRLLNIESMFEAQKGKTFEENVLSLEAGQYHVVVKINGNKETHKGVITLTVERNDKQKFHKNERMSLTDVFVFEMRNNSNAEGSIYKQFEIKNDGLTMGLGFGFNLDEGRILYDKVAGKVDGHVINKAQLQNFHRIVPLAMRLQESEKTSARPIKLTISRYDHRITLEQFLQDNELIDYVNRTNYVVRVNGNPIRVADFTKTILLTWDRVIISPIGGGFGKNGESDKESDALWDIGQWEYHREVPKEKSRDWYNQAFEVFNSVGIETKMIGDRKISAIWLIDNKMPRGMYAYNFHIIDGYRLPHEVIVTNEPVTPGSIAEEAAFHENEAYYWVHGRNMATMTAHVLAAARQRLVFGKNGLTRFDQEQIANMPLDRVERLRAEDQSERHWHHNLIEKYLSSYELEQIQVYEQRFRDAVQLKALLESVFNSPDSEDYQELQRFIGKTSQVLFEGGMIIREPEHRISIKGDYQFTVSIIPLKGKNYWHSETMHMYGYRGRIEFRVFRSGADRLSPEEMEMINQYLLLLSVKSGHRIEQSPARRLTLDPNVPNAMRASFEISKEGEIAQTGDGLVMNSKPNLQIIPLTIELNSIYNEISPSSTDPVMRWSGKGLTEDQHDVVNTAITEHFPGAFQVEHGRLLIPGSEEYQALDPEGVLRERSIRIYVLEGLNQRVAELALGRGIEPPVDLVTHPGRNRGQLYLDATTLPILLGYGEAWRAAWARHELAHILNPSKNERIIQMLAPLPSVTPELQKSAEQNKFTELLTDLIKEMESIIASYAAENSTIKIADSMYNLVEALKQIGPDPKNLAPVLTIYMQHKIYGRDIISNFLAKISIDSVPYLINILDTTNIESDFHLLVHDVAETLGQIGPEAKSSIPLLVKFFLSYSTKTITARIRTTIINALNQIDKEKEYDLLHELFVERYQYVSDKKSYTYLQRTIKKEFGPILVELEESMNNILKNYHKDRDANVLIDSTNTLLDKTITKIRNLLKDGTQSTHAFDLPGLKRGIKVAAKAAGVLLPFLVISGVNLTGLIVHVPQLHEFLVFHPAIRSLITALTIVDLFALGTLVKFGAMFGYTRQMEKLRINVTSIETNGRIEALWRRASGERLLTEQVKSELKITGSLLAPVWNLFVGWFVRNVEIHEMFQEHSDGMMALVPAVGTQLGKTGIASALVAKNADRTTTTSSGWLDNLVVPLRKASKGVQNSLEDAQVVNGAGAIFNLKVQREALENNRKIVYLARVMMADEAKNNSRHVSSATLPEEVPFVNVTELQESSREIIQRIEARLNRISSEDVKLRQLISNLSKNEQVGFALGLEIAEVENQGTDVLADTARKQAKQIEVILNSAQVNSEETLVSHAREINRGHIGSRRLKKAGELKNEVVNMSAVTGEQRTDTQNITRTVTTLDVDVLLKTNGQEGTEQVITTLEAYNKAKQNISGSSDMQLVLVSRANLSARTIRRSVREVLIAEDVDVEMLTHLMTATVHNGKYLRKHDMIQEINLDDGTKEMLIVTERYVQDWRKNDYSVNIVTDNADWTAIQDKLVQIFLYAIGDRLINVSETIDSYRSFRQAINIQA